MTTATATDVERRARQLSATSARRYLDPDEAVPGHVGPGQLLPTELLSVAGLGLDLSPEELVTLSREEVASLTTAGLFFEAVLQAGFGLQIAFDMAPTDPRVTFLLHEMGEETRHSRLFVRLLDQLGPTARNPMDNRLFTAVLRRVIDRSIRRPALLYTLVLAGEEIPDLIQKRSADHPGTDPFIRAVNVYHRQEEARHLSFARAVLPEVWAAAGPVDRWATRHVAPVLIGFMFATLTHPGVYAAAGLPGWATWRAVLRSAPRRALLHEATRPVLQALVDAGAVRPARVPGGWRRLCGLGGPGRRPAGRGRRLPGRGRRTAGDGPPAGKRPAGPERAPA